MSGSHEHPLDRQVWHALSGDHAGFAQAMQEGDGEARRYPLDVGPLGAARDGSASSRAALGALVRASGPLWTLQVADEAPPQGTRQVSRAECVQLVMAAPPVGPDEASAAIPDLMPLAAEHRAQMVALAGLTRPGPFGDRTADLGNFWGVFSGGELVAMAGQRTRPAGHVEVSAVCTRPDHRGRGHAARLIARVAGAIADEDRVAFLTSYADNAAALALYRSLGFVDRTRLWLTKLEPA